MRILSFKSYALASRTTIAKCKIFLALFNYKKISALMGYSRGVEFTLIVMETLDMEGFRAILAVGYEEC